MIIFLNFRKIKWVSTSNKGSGKKLKKFGGFIQIFKVLLRNLLDCKNEPGEKLKPTGFSPLWKFSRKPMFSFWLVYKKEVSSLNRQVDFLWHSSAKKSTQRRINDCCNIKDGALCDNSFQLLTIITKRSILVVTAILNPPLLTGDALVVSQDKIKKDG